MVRGAVVSFPSRPSACVDIWGLAARTCVRGTGEAGGWVGTFSRGADYLNERSDSRSHSFLNRIAEEIIPIRYHRLFFSYICVQLFSFQTHWGKERFLYSFPGYVLYHFRRIARRKEVHSTKKFLVQGQFFLVCAY